MSGTKYFGDTIAQMRTARGLSQGDLARLAGLTQSYISMIESRTRAWSPSPNIVRQFADALNVTETTLRKRAGLPKVDEPEPPAVSVESAIVTDPYLRADQKKALAAMYRSMVAD